MSTIYPIEMMPIQDGYELRFNKTARIYKKPVGVSWQAFCEVVIDAAYKMAVELNAVAVCGKAWYSQELDQVTMM